MVYIEPTNFSLSAHTNLHFNFKNIITSHGFGDKNQYQNIYINLYEAIKRAILNRALDDDAKLPPTRVVAKDLNISRSTVLKAYDLLILEKYIISVKGSGYYIKSIKNKKIQYGFSHRTNSRKYPKLSKKGRSFDKNIPILKSKNPGIAFRPGLPPLDVFPVQIWKKLTNNYWKSVKPSQLSYSNTRGLAHLRDNISNYLKIYRNIHCDPEQIIITSGSLHSLSLIGDLLIDNKDEVVIENPTYPHAYNLFKALRAKIRPASIDGEGVVLTDLTCTRPKLIYTTPSNQYPTGIKMSLARRKELLQWAANKNTLIVEDDYDHEFSNWERPISSVFSLDQQAHTIYLGTFNKLLHPSIRVGYMIVPYHLLDTIMRLYQQSSRFVQPLPNPYWATLLKRII